MEAAMTGGGSLGDRKGTQEEQRRFQKSERGRHREPHKRVTEGTKSKSTEQRETWVRNDKHEREAKKNEAV
jgi:hypothetical protein